MFYCNRNKKGITIGQWYNVRDDSIKNYDIIDKIKIENKLLKEKIKELENQIIDLKLKKINNIDINKEGTTILLVEQNANMALSIADRAYVIETGRVILSGTAEELQASEEIKNAYLGGH